jgi:hypothetical protein
VFPEPALTVSLDTHAIDLTLDLELGLTRELDEAELSHMNDGLRSFVELGLAGGFGRRAGDPFVGISRHPRQQVHAIGFRIVTRGIDVGAWRILCNWLRAYARVSAPLSSVALQSTDRTGVFDRVDPDRLAYPVCPLPQTFSLDRSTSPASADLLVRICFAQTPSAQVSRTALQSLQAWDVILQGGYLFDSDDVLTSASEPVSLTFVDPRTIEFAFAQFLAAEEAVEAPLLIARQLQLRGADVEEVMIQ